MNILKKIFVIAVLLGTTFMVYKALTRHEEIKVVFEENLYSQTEKEKTNPYNFKATSNLDLNYELVIDFKDKNIDLSKLQYILYLNEEEIENTTLGDEILYEGVMEKDKEYNYSLYVIGEDKLEYSVDFK